MNFTKKLNNYKKSRRHKKPVQRVFVTVIEPSEIKIDKPLFRDDILNDMCHVLQTTKSEMKSKTRSYEMLRKRNSMMYFLRFDKGYTLKKTAETFNTHHTTVMNAIDCSGNIDEEMIKALRRNI